MDIAVSIRSAVASDHGQLTPLFDELDRLPRDGAPWLLQKPDRNPRPLAWLEALLANPNSAVLVADAGMCVGVATIHLRAAPAVSLFIPQQHAVIDDIVVHPDWRRRGIARKLYNACGAWGRARKASWVEVNVYDFNTDALDFYTGIGFGTTMRKMRKPLDE
jgi:ribosomal protein S18 acetylase RimI-like enzyme